MSIIVTEKINIIDVMVKSDSIIPITDDAEDNTDERILLSKKSPITEDMESDIRHKSKYIIGGKKITAITIIAYVPSKFFVILRQERIAVKESETVLPTTGTTLPTRNFAVFEKALSEETETNVPSPMIPEKTVMVPQIIQVEKFFIVFASSDVFIPETAPETEIARYIPISGAAISPTTLDIIVTALSIRVRNPIAEETYPVAVIAEEYTGIKPSIKSEHSFIIIADEKTMSFIGKRKTDVAVSAEV